MMTVLARSPGAGSFLLDAISLELNPEALRPGPGASPEASAAACPPDLLQEAERLARPKALYRAASVESKDEEQVIVEGATFRSRVLRVNLDKALRVFPFVATCGVEMEAWADSKRDMLDRYWAEAVSLLAVRQARGAVVREIGQRHATGRLSWMSPGSLPDWPLEEQRPLFGLLGDTEALIGVRLTDSLVMVPRHSMSGIFFPSQRRFQSCQLCPRESCPGRRAPFDGTLYDRSYGKR